MHLRRFVKLRVPKKCDDGVSRFRNAVCKAEALLYAVPPISYEILGGNKDRDEYISYA